MFGHQNTPTLSTETLNGILKINSLHAGCHIFLSILPIKENPTEVPSLLY